MCFIHLPNPKHWLIVLHHLTSWRHATSRHDVLTSRHDVMMSRDVSDVVWCHGIFLKFEWQHMSWRHDMMSAWRHDVMWRHGMTSRRHVTSRHDVTTSHDGMMSRDVTRWHRMHSGEQTMKDTSIEFPSPFFGPLKLHIVKIWPVIWSLVF